MDYYDEEYFNWQKNIGAFGGKANLFKFKNEINKKDKIIDFGSGGGYLLANLTCAKKKGIEINKTARDSANMMGIETHQSIDEINDEWADVIISNHALEHVENPLFELKNLYKKLKPGGKIVFVVPYEKKNKYKPNDINFHLYTWSEMNLGNLFTHAGFEVVSSKELKYKWPPYFIKLHSFLGANLFKFTCKLYGIINNKVSQVKVIAKKPS